MSSSNGIDPKKMDSVSSIALEDSAGNDNGYHYISRNFDLKKRFLALRCLRCKEFIPLQACSNCTGEQYRPGHTHEGQIGLFCMDCKNGFANWECQSCGTSNPVSSKTVFAEKEEGGCFIATAVYNHYSSPEVIIFRNFRDRFLLKNTSGKFLVFLYYSVSPQIASVIRKNKTIKGLFRKILDFLAAKISQFNPLSG